MARIDETRIPCALAREDLEISGTMALACLEQLAQRAEIARSMGVWESVREPFEAIVAEVEKKAGRIKGRTLGTLEPNDGGRQMARPDLTPIQDALLHEEMPKLKALAFEAITRIASRADLARDTGVWPQVRFDFEDFVDEAAQRLAYIRGEEEEDHL